MINFCKTINIHCVKHVLDESKKININRYVDRIFSVKNGLENIKHTIDINTNIVTILDDKCKIGDVIDVWLYCFRSSENGGIQPIATAIQSDEQLLQNAKFI